LDRRGRLLGSLNQSRRRTPALAASPRFLSKPQPLFAGPAPDGIAAPGSIARSTNRRSRRRWIFRLLALSLLIAGSAAGLQLGTTGARPPSALLAHIDQWLTGKGLGIDQVSLEGHRYTTDADIFDALDLVNAGSMLRFNGTEAANRMLRLSWVERVQIKPLVPNGLHVVITERTPFAVWEYEGRRQLIDKSGHRLASVGPASFTRLPRVHGDSAHTAVADLHATLSLFPAIETRLSVAQRIGGRRWVLVLDNGVKVHLPAEQDAAAIQRLAALQAGTGLLDRDVAEIDLRGANVTVRPRSLPGGFDGPTGSIASTSTQRLEGVGP
jgi:cell division protein FtsQ